MHTSVQTQEAYNVLAERRIANAIEKSSIAEEGEGLMLDYSFYIMCLSAANIMRSKSECKIWKPEHKLEGSGLDANFSQDVVGNLKQVDE